MAFKFQGGGTTPFGVAADFDPEESFMSSYSSNYGASPSAQRSQPSRPAGAGAMMRSQSFGGSRPSSSGSNRAELSGLPSLSRHVGFRGTPSEVSPVSSGIFGQRPGSFSGKLQGDGGGRALAASSSAGRFMTLAAGVTPSARATQANTAAFGEVSAIPEDGSGLLEDSRLSLASSFASLGGGSSASGASFLRRPAPNWAEASGNLDQSLQGPGSNRTGKKTAQRKTLEVLDDPELLRHVKHIFNKYDCDHNQQLGPHETRAMLRALHDELGLARPDMAAAERIFKKYDANNSGSLSYDEFLQLFTSLLRRAVFDRKALMGRDFFVQQQRGTVWDYYEQKKELGHGAFGKAYLCRHKMVGEERVVKVVKKSRGRMPVQDIEREVLIMQQIDHPHVVRLFEWYEDRIMVALVLEALHGGTLREVMLKQKDAKRGLREDWSRKVMHQVLDGMCYCHSMQVMHKDLKDENIMLLKRDPNYDEPFAVIIDLGIAELFALSDPVGRRVGGTPTTMAPEVWAGTFGPKCDVWSLGCVLFQLLSGALPFMTNRINPGVWRSLHRRGPDYNAIRTSGESRDLCKSMLIYNESARLSIASCLDHEWFRLEQHRLKVVPAVHFSEMQDYCKQTDLQRALMLELASKMPIEKAGRVVEIFEAWDTNQDGSMPFNELRSAMRELGIDDGEFVRKIFNAMDVNKDGSLSFTEFAAGCMILFHDLVEDRLYALFEEYDTAGTGCLDETQVMHFVDNALDLIGGSKQRASLMKVFSQGYDCAHLRFDDLRDMLLGRAPQSARSSRSG